MTMMVQQIMMMMVMMVVMMIMMMVIMMVVVMIMVMLLVMFVSETDGKTLLNKILHVWTFLNICGKQTSAFCLSLSGAGGFVMADDKMLPRYERDFVEWEIEKDLKSFILFNRQYIRVYREKL